MFFSLMETLFENVSRLFSLRLPFTPFSFTVGQMFLGILILSLSCFVIIRFLRR